MDDAEPVDESEPADDGLDSMRSTVRLLHYGDYGDEIATEQEVDKDMTEIVYQEMKGDASSEPERTCLLYMFIYGKQFESHQVMHLPPNTLYTAAMVMPMVARSSGYTKTMTALALKMILLTFMCISLQGALISSFYHARSRLPSLDGVPSLCTYGQDVNENETPYGPTGRVFAKNYRNIETDYTRLMVRNHLAAVMEKWGVKNDAIGPVEYGMESTTCRFICVVVFCLSLCGEIFGMDRMLACIFKAPTLKACCEDSDLGEWVCFNKISGCQEAKEIWPIIGKSSLDHVTFKCSGMPLFWKMFCVFLLSCRFAVCMWTLWNGIMFLMNTGSIVELILDSVALVFIIELDRVMFTGFARGIPKDIVQRLEPLRVKRRRGMQKAFADRVKKEMDWACCSIWGCCKLLGRFIDINRMTLVLAAMAVGGHYLYFYWYCNLQAWPGNLSDLGIGSYFEGNTRFLGGWEFAFGSWYSKDTVVEYLDEVTCHPAFHALKGDEHTPPRGCGLPGTGTGH